MNIDASIVHEHRCDCGRLLGKGILISSTLEIKCGRCNKATALPSIGDALAENDTHYIALCDTSLAILDVSPSAPKILQFSKPELCTMSLKDLDPLLKMGAYDHLWRDDMVYDMAECHLETIQRRKNGSLIPVQVHIRFIRRIDTLYILSSFEHLVARTTVDADTSVSNRPRYGAEYVLKLDALGRCVHASGRLLILLGCAPQEIIGESLFSLCQTESSKQTEEEFHQHTKTGVPFMLSLHITTVKEKRVLTLESYFVPDYDSKDGKGYFHVTLWPI